MKSININFQQLEYIVAVDTYRHFKTAADKCFVTQPTLSMMIQKLEEELGTQLFDRSKHPVIPTESGVEIIKQARIILESVNKIPEIIQEQKNILKGELRLAVIPTVAPYLLPLFVSSFIQKYKDVKLKISELTTNQIITALENGQIDAGILATPLQKKNLKETPLYYEQFVVYASDKEEVLKMDKVEINNLNNYKIWFLEEGHCMRNQVLNLCSLPGNNEFSLNLEYESGSIETLKRMVKMNSGITILPELALDGLNEAELKQIRYFENPPPVREISLVIYRHFVKKRILDALSSEISNNLPQSLKSAEQKKITGIFI